MASQKILVADDSLTTKKIIQLVLANEGYEIRTASDGKETLQQIALFQPDVVLLDVSLPDQNAYQIKEKINTTPEGPKTRFILMSSAFETVDETKAKSLGFAARIVKPFEPAQLKQVLSKVLGAPNAPAFDAEPSAPPPFSFQPETPLEATPTPFEQTDSITFLTPSSGDDPMKQLTDSTLGIGGFSEYSWSVQEPSATSPSSETPEWRDPTHPPTYPTPDLWTEGKTFDPSKSDFPLPKFDNLTDIGESTFDLHKTQDLKPATRPTVPPPTVKAPPAPTVTAPHVSTPSTPAMTSHEVRKMVEEEIRKLVPEIAEKVIREEIHRILSQEL